VRVFRVSFTMKALLLCVLLAVVSAVMPAIPASCTSGQTACIWYGNFVPSTVAPNFDFYINHTHWRDSVAYGQNAIAAYNCGFYTTFGIGDSNGNSETDTSSLPSIQCGVLYSFFAARKPDTQGNNGNPNTPNYQVIAYEISTAPSGVNWVPGYVFHMIYNQRNINVAYCDGSNDNCNRNNNRQNTNINTAAMQQIQLEFANNFENPVTINGGTTLFDSTVVNSANTYSYWVFYGDNNNQGQFPVVGGSGASMISASLLLIALLNVVTLLL